MLVLLEVQKVGLFLQVYPYLTLNHMDYLIVMLSTYSSRIVECVNHASTCLLVHSRKHSKDFF